MVLLAEFTVLRPDPGLIIWATLIFLLFWGIMAKYAFGPIRDALKKREADIQNALDQAAMAKEEMANLKAENEKILAEARAERSQILKEAKETKDAIVNEAKNKAKEEAKRIVVSAKNEIENQKKAAISELKNMTGQLAVSIAEKVLKQELKDGNTQSQLINSLIDDIKLN